MITAADIEKLQLGSSHWTCAREEKWCNGCDKVKPIAAFRMRKSGADGKYYRANKCKRCEQDEKKRRQREAKLARSYSPDHRADGV